MDDPSITFTPTVVEDDSGSEQVITGTAEIIDQHHVALITHDGTQQVRNPSLHPMTHCNSHSQTNNHTDTTQLHSDTDHNTSPSYDTYHDIQYIRSIITSFLLIPILNICQETFPHSRELKHSLSVSHFGQH